MRARTTEALMQARDEFQRAVDLDPNFALAWVGVADANLLLRAYDAQSLDETIPKAQLAIDKALALNPSLGEAYAAMGSLRSMQERFPEAEDAYRRATELSPNYATAWHWYSNYLRRRPTRLQEALVMGERALELDPLSSIIRSNLSSVHYELGNLPQAELMLNELIDLDPDFPQGYSALANVVGTSGRLVESFDICLKALDRDPDNLGILAGLFFGLWDVGSTERALEMLGRMEDLDPANEVVLHANVSRLLRMGGIDGLLEYGGQIRLTESAPGTRYLKGLIYANAERYPEALELMVYPGADYTDREAWPELMESYSVDSCDVAWVYLHTGQEALARELVEYTIDYVLNELPQYTPNADRVPMGDCYMALGDVESALDDLEKRIDNRWPINQEWIKHWPAWKAARMEPRFAELVQKLDAHMALQRPQIEALYDAYDWSGP